MYQKFAKTEVTADRSSIPGAETGQKKRESLKSLMSKRNFLICGMALLAFWGFTEKAMGQKIWHIGHSNYNSSVIATLSGNTLTISGNGNMADFWCSGAGTVPPDNEYNTGGEAPWWFNTTYRDAIKTVIIQNGVMNIGMRAFKDCKNLESISIPNSVTKINGQAFKDCSKLNTVTIENGNSNLEFAGYSSSDPCNNNARNKDKYDWFEGCTSFTTLHLGRNYSGDFISNIRTSLTNLTIGNMVTSIGNGAFNNCDRLNTVTIQGGTTVKLGFVGISNSNRGSHFASSPIVTLYLGRNLETGFSVGYCNGAPFQGNDKLKYVTIGSDVTEINANSFYQCRGLQSLIFGNKLETIGENAFFECSSLDGALVVPNTVETIKSAAFKGCSTLPSVTIPISVMSIGNEAFNNCDKLKTVTIQGGTTVKLGFVGISNSNRGSHFASSPIVTLYLGRNLETGFSVGYCNGAPFQGNGKLQYITIGNDVTEINANSFYQCRGLQSLTIGNKLKTIGENAFFECNNLDGALVVPNTVTTIGSAAFKGCSTLPSVTIPISVISIGNEAFNNCDKLNTVTIEGGTTVKLGFVGISNSNRGSHFASSPIVTLYLGRNLETGFSIGYCNGAPFQGNGKLKYVTIGNDVTEINANSFYNCSSLIQITSNRTDPPKIESNTFSGIGNNNPKNVNVKVPCNSICTYKAASGWSSFTNYQSITNSCTSPCLSSGIEEYTIQIFQIFPNPAQTELFIRSELQIEKVEICSLTGVLLLSENNFNERISVSGLPQGVYLLKVYTDKGVAVSKVVKE